MDYEGNEYRVPLDYIRDSGQFQNFDKLNPVTISEHVEGHERPEEQAKGTSLKYELEEIRPYVRVADFW